MILMPFDLKQLQASATFSLKFSLFGKVSAHCFTDNLKSLMYQALRCLDEFVIVHNVIEMGFDLNCVCRTVQNKHVMTGTSYISESELIADLVRSGRQESSSAESRGMPHTHIPGGA